MKKRFLEVHFLGMCTFAPERDGSGVWVFLTVDRSLPSEVPAHAPYVRFPLDHIKSGLPGDGLWALINYRIEVIGIRDEPLDVVCFDMKNNCCLLPPDRRPPECFGWVASVEDACAARGVPGKGTLLPRFKDPYLNNDDLRHVGARFFIKSGKLRTVKLSGAKGELLLSRFRPFESNLYDRDHRQLTATEVCWEIEVPGDDVTFLGYSLKDGELLERATFKFPMGVDRLTIKVMNEEAELLVGMASRVPFRVGMPRMEDRVFESVYNICYHRDKKEMPIPVGERLIPGYDWPIVDGSPPCSPHRVATAITDINLGEGGVDER